MRDLLYLGMCVIVGWSITACGTRGLTQGPETNSSIVQATPTITSSAEKRACERLSEITKLSNRLPPEEFDPIVKQILAEGDKAIPCLIEQITDETPTEDVRGAPIWQNYVVGDTAIILLMRLDGAEFEKVIKEMLPSPYREEWDTNGIYAYFNYVIESENRAKLKEWWKKRKANVLKTHANNPTVPSGRSKE